MTTNNLPNEIYNPKLNPLQKELVTRLIQKVQIESNFYTMGEMHRDEEITEARFAQGYFRDADMQTAGINKLKQRLGLEEKYE